METPIVLTPHALDAAAFRSALGRGLGRCVMVLRFGADVEPHREALREAFGRTLAYDPQCEGTRLDYLFDLARVASMRDELRAIALASLPTCTDRWDIDQHTAVALEFARRGDEEAASVIRASFDGLDLDSRLLDGLGWALVQLDGLAGLVHGLRRLGQRPALEASSGSGQELRRVAVDEFGEEATDEAIAAAAATDPLVAAQLEAMRAVEKTETKPWTLPASLSELIEDARPYGARGARYMRSVSWGRQASEEDRREATEALREAREPWLQAVLTRVWWAVREPAPVDVLLPLVESPEHEVAEAAARALIRTSDPAVRALAWRLIEAGSPRWNALQMLTANRQPDDSARLMPLLARVPDDSDELHSIASTLLDLFGGEQVDAGSIAPLRWIYEQSPCSRCRRDAVTALDSIDAVEPTMRTECRWDSNDEIREWARAPRDGASKQDRQAGTNEAGEIG